MLVLEALSLLMIWHLLLKLDECNGSAIGKFFKTLKGAHFNVAISSRIREGCENLWWILGWGSGS
jgi:hypothetical protein